MRLRPCAECRRHVIVDETACPFCATDLPPAAAPWLPPVGRITRAAIFSAALVACGDKTADSPKPAPAPGQGSDELEKLLDVEPTVVERPAPLDAASDAASSLAAAGDASVPSDAGVDPDLARKRKVAADRKRKLREQRLREQRERELQAVPDPSDYRHLAKPYGAPPARRRLV